MTKKDLITTAGLLWLAFLIWLPFHNWHAAVFVVLLQIAFNTGSAVGVLKRNRMGK